MSETFREASADAPVVRPGHLVELVRSLLDGFAAVPLPPASFRTPYLPPRTTGHAGAGSPGLLASMLGE